MTPSYQDFLPRGILDSHLEMTRLRQGKVRDVYDLDAHHLLLVSTDRLSAFDVVFPDPIPAKGLVLNQLSGWWFQRLGNAIPNHFVTAEPPQVMGNARLEGRCTVGKKTHPLPVECVVRGTLDGSAWKDYQATGQVSGIPLPPGLRRRDSFPQPLFTPSTKAESGHDVPIGFDRVVELVGPKVAETIRFHSIELFQMAYHYLRPLGILLGDTKFEFGLNETGEVLLIDEILTPDSSRFWEADSYGPDHLEPRSFDKQFVRDYCERLGWSKTPPAPHLPEDILRGTSNRYLEIFRRITGQSVMIPNGLL